MEFGYIIISMLAVWRATYMLQEETGPFEIFSKIQAWFWTDPVRLGGLKDGLRCFYCTSVWISFLAAFMIGAPTVWIFILNWFAIAAGAMIINDLYDKLKQ